MSANLVSSISILSFYITNATMITIYTDGSSIGNPGPWWRGVLIVKNWDYKIKHDIEIVWGEQWTTNNRMELLALIKALEWIREQWYSNMPITIHMDSMYVHDGIEKYLTGRIAKGWRLANKKPVLNKDLRSIVSTILPRYSHVSWKRVKAHATNAHNNKVDQLARKEAIRMQKLLPPDFTPPIVTQNADTAQKPLF